MTASEALRRRLEHSDGLHEQGIPVDEIVSVVEAAERTQESACIYEGIKLPDGTPSGRVHYPLRDALTALNNALEEK